MLISQFAEKHGLHQEIVQDIIDENWNFFKKHMDKGVLDTLAVKALEERLPEQTEQQEYVASDKTAEITEAIVEEESTKTSVKTMEKKPRKKKVTKPKTEETEDYFENVPGAILRKFAFDNLSIKVEKLAFMSDNEIMELVKSKYYAIGVDDTVLFAKKANAVLVHL